MLWRGTAGEGTDPIACPAPHGRCTSWHSKGATELSHRKARSSSGSDTSDGISGSGLSPGYEMIISELRNKVLEKARTIIDSISSKAARMTHQNRKQETEKSGPSFINDFLLILYPEKKKRRRRRYCTPKKNMMIKNNVSVLPPHWILTCVLRRLFESASAKGNVSLSRTSLNLRGAGLNFLHLCGHSSLGLLMQLKPREEQIIMMRDSPGLLECLLDGQSYATGSCH